MIFGARFQRGIDLAGLKERHLNSTAQLVPQPRRLPGVPACGELIVEFAALQLPFLLQVLNPCDQRLEGFFCAKIFEGAQALFFQETR